MFSNFFEWQQTRGVEVRVVTEGRTTRVKGSPSRPTMSCSAPYASSAVATWRAHAHRRRQGHQSAPQSGAGAAPLGSSVNSHRGRNEQRAELQVQIRCLDHRRNTRWIEIRMGGDTSWSHQVARRWSRQPVLIAQLAR